MARVCKVTGKRPLVGNNVSHAHNKTKRRQYPNLQTKRIYVEHLGKHVRVRLSVRALKTVTNTGLMPYLKKQGLKLQDVIA
jgi:large subunit ribosomal protein L28